MIEIIKKRESGIDTTYVLHFTWKDSPGAGYAFDCDENGNLFPMQDIAKDSYAFCIAESAKPDGKLIADGVRTYLNKYYSPAEGRCHCGETVVLDGFTNTCACCGADYNYTGQELAPREQWGEETGESLADILSIR